MGMRLRCSRLASLVLANYHGVHRRILKYAAQQTNVSQDQLVEVLLAKRSRTHQVVNRPRMFTEMAWVLHHDIGLITSTGQHLRDAWEQVVEYPNDPIRTFKHLPPRPLRKFRRRYPHQFRR